jgi:hypothetical protein
MNYLYPLNSVSAVTTQAVDRPTNHVLCGLVHWKKILHNRNLWKKNCVALATSFVIANFLQICSHVFCRYVHRFLYSNSCSNNTFLSVHFRCVLIMYVPIESPMNKLWQHCRLRETHFQPFYLKLLKQEGEGQHVAATGSLS